VDTLASTNDVLALEGLWPLPLLAAGRRMTGAEAVVDVLSSDTVVVGRKLSATLFLQISVVVPKVMTTVILERIFSMARSASSARITSRIDSPVSVFLVERVAVLTEIFP
jgi:hypothetical protein